MIEILPIQNRRASKKNHKNKVKFMKNLIIIIIFA